jgi:hypothetical protein
MPRRTSPEELLGLLTGVLIRLDLHDGYEVLVERVIDAGDAAVPALAEVVDQIDSKDTDRKRIRDSAARVLRVVRTQESYA